MCDVPAVYLMKQEPMDLSLGSMLSVEMAVEDGEVRGRSIAKLMELAPIHFYSFLVMQICYDLFGLEILVIWNYKFSELWICLKIISRT